MLIQKTQDNTLKQLAVDQIERAGSFHYTRQYLQDIESKAMQEIESLEENVHLSSIIKYLSKAYCEKIEL